MEMDFCRRCGAPCTHVCGGFFTCANNHKLHTSAAPTTGIILTNVDSQVLVTTRGIQPGEGMLDIPGGFIDMGETAEEALAREITEELGLTVDNYSEPTFFCTATNDYLYDGEYRSVLTLVFQAELKQGISIQAQDDVADAFFMNIEDIHLDEIYGQDIKHAISLYKSRDTAK